ncbi:MAG: hypothetical protein JXQ93_06375 [Flavobacteriaceae bacterium]
MRKILCLIICLTLMQCGRSKKPNSLGLANVLYDCLTSEDIDILNEGITVFENHLKKAYEGSQDSELEVYKKYLNNLSRMSFDRSFFQSKESIDYLIKLKKTKTFKVLYKLYEEPKYDDEVAVPITSRDEQIQEKEEFPDFFVLDEGGSFSSCLRKKSTVKDLKDYFETLKKVSDIAPTIKAGAFLEILKKSDKDLEIIKLSIAFDIYYVSMLMFNRL